MCRLRPRPTSLVLAALAAGALHDGCRAGQVAPGHQTLRLAVRADITGIFPNPPTANEAYTIHLTRNVLESLARFDRQLEPEPSLAAHWESPTDHTYVFTLRAGVRFSDGRPLAAADVVASLEASRRRRWPTQGFLQAIESVQALDEERVQIRTRSQYFILLSKLPFGFVWPAGLVAQPEVPPIGTGPYRIEAWRPREELVFTRNSYFRGPAPAFERVRLRVVPDARTRIAMVEGGEADLADHVPPEWVERLETRDEMEVVERESLRVLFLCLRMDRPPFSDPRVREAFDLAIDRRDLIARALAGRAEPASQLVPRAVFGFDPSLTMTAPDRDRSRRLLAEAGYGRGLSVRLDGPNNRYVNDEAIQREIARQLAEVGVRVELNLLDKGEWLTLITAGESSFHLLGWACESGDAGDALDAILHSRGPEVGGTNTTALADPELDRLIDEANAADGLAVRRLRLQAALARAASLRPVLPLVAPHEIVLLSRRVSWDPPINLAFEFAAMRPRVPGEPAAPR